MGLAFMSPSAIGCWTPETGGKVISLAEAATASAASQLMLLNMLQSVIVDYEDELAVLKERQ